MQDSRRFYHNAYTIFAERVDWMQEKVSAPTERLETLYVCRRCNARFLFHSDMEYHQKMVGHDGVFEMPLKPYDTFV